MLDFKVESIIYVCEDNKEKRAVISINGIPFYQSTGHNSAFPNTWFPFLGLVEEAGSRFLPRGYLIKPIISKIPSKVEKKIDKLFPSYGSADAGRALPQRFGTLPCMLISSFLNDGLWTLKTDEYFGEDDRGLKLKKYLQDLYPKFYRSLPKIQFIVIKETKSVEEINQWLCHKAGVRTITELKKFFPTRPNHIKLRDGIIKARSMPEELTPERSTDATVASIVRTVSKFFKPDSNSFQAFDAPSLVHQTNSYTVFQKCLMDRASLKEKHKMKPSALFSEKRSRILGSGM